MGSSITIDSGYGLIVMMSSGAAIGALYLVYGLNTIVRLAGVDSNHLLVEKPTEYSTKITDILGYGITKVVFIGM